MRTWTLRLVAAALCFSAGATIGLRYHRNEARLVQTPQPTSGRLCSSATQLQSQEVVPTNWRTIKAENYYTFRAPVGMKLIGTERCVECAWGSTYSTTGIMLFAEYSSWNEEYAPEYLAKQKEYQKEWTEIDGKCAKVQSWRLDENRGYGYETEVRFYGPDKKLMARMTALCKTWNDVEMAKQIFRSVDFSK